MNPERTAADELQVLYLEKRDASARVERLAAELAEAQKAELVAHLRYKRQALWIKADELRRQLAETEAAAADIRLED